MRKIRFTLTLTITAVIFSTHMACSQSVSATAIGNAALTGTSLVYTSGAPLNEAAHLFKDSEIAASFTRPGTFFVTNPSAQEHILLSAGTAYSNLNQAYMGLFYAGAGSTNNFGTLGLYGEDYILVWTPAGNVGIGTTTPSAKLELNGSLRLSSGSGTSITFPDQTVQSTAWNGVLSGGDYAESVDVADRNEHYEPEMS